jgi:hypothetical protein
MIGFNGGLIGKDRTTSFTEAKGVWTLDEQIKAQRTNTWPVTSILYRYIRWTITANRGNGNTQANEFNIRIGATNISMSGATVTVDPPSADGSNFGTPISRLIDNNTATNWFTTTAVPISLFFDMGSATLFDGYQWVTGGDATERDPTSWTVSGSVDGTTYITLDTKTSFATTTSRQAVVGPFTFS